LEVEEEVVEEKAFKMEAVCPPNVCWSSSPLLYLLTHTQSLVFIL
jgi:hypothetical protein